MAGHYLVSSLTPIVGHADRRKWQAPGDRRSYHERVSIYAAYGTSLDPARMAGRAPHSPLVATGWLEGWRLTFGECLTSAGEPGGVLPTLAEDPGQRVFVALYDLMRWDEPHLDFWQGALEGPGRRPRSGTVPGDGRVYRRMTVRARTAARGLVTAWAYVLDGYEGGVPSASQVNELATAAKRAGAPSWYVSELLTRECLPDRP